MYVVVEFTESSPKVVEIIPASWMTDDRGTACYWPNTRNSEQISKAVRRQVEPMQDWKTYAVRKLREAETYEDARRICKKAEATSNLETEDDAPRRRRNRCNSDSSSDSDPQPSKRAHVYLQQKKAAKSLKRVPLVNKKRRSQSEDSDCEPPVPPTRTIDAESTARSLPEHPIAAGTSLQLSSPCENVNSLEGQSNGKAYNKVLMALVREMKEIRATQAIHTNLLASMLETLRKGPTAENASSFPEQLHLPLQTMDEVKAAEQMLEDEEVFKALTSAMVNLGGNSITHFIKRSMQSLLTVQLERQFSLEKPRPGKEPFKPLKLFAALRMAVKRNASTANCTVAELEDRLSTYLINARDRKGGRKERLAKKKENQKTRDDIADNHEALD